MSIKKKIAFLPYDFDTAIGISNEGTLVFDYSLEDTDHLEGGANVYNGQDSVLWNNVRDAFGAELAEMYKQLRSTGALSYAKVEQMFEEHQGKWSEAIFNEDSWFKYIDPLVQDGSGAYLSMMQGSKAEQRKWWLYNRFRYIDSKYNAGDALSDLIQIRGYAKSDITVTPYADIYPTVKYGSYLVKERGHRGQPTTLECPMSTLNDTEIYIYSASQLASVGDLSGFKVGFADLSMASKLQEVKLGDSDSEYDNPNLSALTFGNNVLLKKIDVRNCSGLGDTSMQGHTQQAVDISGCSIVEEIYFDGTKITGLTLPNGGVIKKLHLPGTITNLTIRNQTAITEFVLPDYTNITTLRLENVASVVNSKAILNAIPAASRVRLIGFYWTAQDADEIEDLLDLLDTMRGLDEAGGNVDTAQVSGEIHTSALTGAQIAEYNARYPYLSVTADHTSAVLSFYNGSTLITTQTVLDGGDGSYSGSTPTKTQDAQYTYTFAGWSKTNDNTVDADALTAITADRSVYACFIETLRTYTATFIRASEDGGGTLYTQNNVPYGTTPTYAGSTPTTTQGSAEDYPFLRWSPELTGITGDTTYTAMFGGDWAIFNTPDFDVQNTYAIQWHYDQNIPKLARGGLASNFGNPNPATSVSGNGSSPFDNIYPWSDMRRYNILSDGTIISDADENFSQTENDTMVWIPPFYYKSEKDAENNQWTWAISPVAKTGFELHPGSGKYVARYHMSGSSSLSGKGVGTGTFANLKSNANNKGTGWSIINFEVWSAIQLLYLVEFANFDSKTTLGRGRKNYGVSGGTDDSTYHTIKSSSMSPQYRWIEDPFTNAVVMLDGATYNSNNGYVVNNTTLEVTRPSNGYISGFGYSEIAPWAFLPDTTSGTYSTYVSAALNANDGNHLCVGGGLNDSTSSYHYNQMGMFRLYNFGDGSTRSGHGSRLLYSPVNT